jgi:hypothetical protein
VSTVKCGRRSDFFIDPAFIPGMGRILVRRLNYVIDLLGASEGIRGTTLKTLLSAAKLGGRG